MSSYYLYLECETCDEEMVYGPCYTTRTRDGKPMVEADAEYTLRFYCDNCSGETYVGEIDTYHEEGEIPEEEEDDCCQGLSDSECAQTTCVREEKDDDE